MMQDSNTLFAIYYYYKSPRLLNRLDSCVLRFFDTIAERPWENRLRFWDCCCCCCCCGGGGGATKPFRCKAFWRKLVDAVIRLFSFVRNNFSGGTAIGLCEEL